jgi:hypothetical protein
MKGIYKYALIVIASMLIYLNIQAQTQKPVHGVVLDSITRQPISNVNISVDKFSGTISDGFGRFQLIIKKKDKSAVFSHVNYLSKEVTFSQVKTILDTVFLIPKIVELPIFEISTKNSFSGKQTETIIDYTITNDLIVLLLQVNGKTALEFHELYNPVKAIFRQFIPFKSDRFYTDLFYQVHLIADDSVRQLRIDENRNISFYSAVSRKYFDQVLGNTLAATSENIITMEYNTFSQQYNYYLIGIDSSYQQCFFKIYDQKKQKEIAQRYGEFSNAQNTYNSLLEYYNVTPEMSESPHARKVSLDLFKKTAAFQNISKSSYNPLFVKNDSIFAFDLVNHQLHIFGKTGQELKTLMIDFCLEQGFCRVLQAYQSDDFYCYKMVNGIGYISKIDTKTGKALNYITLENALFPEKIQIENNTVFCIAKSSFTFPKKLFWFKYTL